MSDYDKSLHRHDKKTEDGCAIDEWLVRKIQTQQSVKQYLDSNVSARGGRIFRHFITSLLSPNDKLFENAGFVEMNQFPTRDQQVHNDEKLWSELESISGILCTALPKSVNTSSSLLIPRA